ncbi:hypothetical protein IGB42_00767 [Andreprevotia sp. IGB-42]|uniref:DUF4118 domain-containing protein n=1 Tax=Andreprevotia sp. IGB-42 TaxID=2497473 RepID=UPI00135A1A04|nr:DUF4118 domain-containing protein [Andreprevotia sp. IGB-42]KAF0814712.1 hypothetical protein IGB42_00767 [Andreprevotia sp. IGB-42]
MSQLFANPLDNPQALRRRHVLISALLLAAVIAIGMVLGHFGRHGVADMLLIVPVVYASLYLGLAGGLAISVASIIAYDFFFLWPYYRFGVHSVETAVRLGVLMTSALICVQVIARLHDKAVLVSRTQFALAARQTDLEAELALRLQDPQHLRTRFPGLFDAFPAAVLWLRNGRIEAANNTARAWLALQDDHVDPAWALADEIITASGMRLRCARANLAGAEDGQIVCMLSLGL